MGPDGMIRIAVIGAIGESKGFALLESCISDAAIRDLPLIFHIVGFTQEDESLLKFPNVRITGRYRPDQAPEVIRQTGAGIALFLSPWPETWSYTLSEALDEGLLPVSLDIGAIAERIRKAKTGHLVPLEVKGSSINDALIKIAEEGNSRGAPLLRPERDADLSVLDFYYGFKNLKSPTKRKNQTGSRKTSKPLKSPKRSTGALA
jgi:glycosyltransferase involved in cell wall biosynthesis